MPLLKYHAELTGGGLEINSLERKGTEVKATFSFKHIDRQPLGDIVGVLVLLMAANQELDLIYQHKTDKGEYRFSSKETKEYLEVESLGERKLLWEIGCMIAANLKEIEVSGFDLKESYKVIL